jgi:hypothetical protein
MFLNSAGTYLYTGGLYRCSGGSNLIRNVGNYGVTRHRVSEGFNLYKHCGEHLTLRFRMSVVFKELFQKYAIFVSQKLNLLELRPKVIRAVNKYRCCCRLSERKVNSVTFISKGLMQLQSPSARRPAVVDVWKCFKSRNTEICGLCYKIYRVLFLLDQ